MIPVVRRFLAPYRGPVAVVLVLLFIGAIGTLYLPELNAEIINEGVAKGDTDAVLRIGAVMLGVSFLLMVAAGIAAWFSALVAMGFGRDVRSAVFRAIEGFGRPELDRFGTASLITRTTNDVQQVQQVVLMALAMMISAPILVIGGLIMALRQDIPLSGILDRKSTRLNSSH